MCAHMHACEIVSLFQHFLFHSWVRTLHTTIAQFKENIDFFFFYIFCIFYVWNFHFVPSVRGQQGCSVRVAAVFSVVFAATAGRSDGLLGRSCQQSTKIIKYLKTTKNNT